MTEYAKKPCAKCGKEHTNKKYCSLKCQMDYQRDERRTRIQEAGRLFSRTEKWYLIETKGHKCEICGLSEWLDEPILLILDHKNGDSSDWLLTNLRLVCSNCDATLPTYKSRNNGSGRAFRRQRYSEGKSY